MEQVIRKIDSNSVNSSYSCKWIIRKEGKRKGKNKKYIIRATHKWIIPCVVSTVTTTRDACIDGCLGLQHTEITTGLRYIMQQVLWTIPRPPAYNTLYRCILLLSFGINSANHHLPEALYYLHARNTYCIHESRLACHFTWYVWQRSFRNDCVNFVLPYSFKPRRYKYHVGNIFRTHRVHRKFSFDMDGLYSSFNCHTGCYVSFSLSLLSFFF